MKLLVKAVVVAGFLAFALSPAGFAAAELTVEDMLFLDMETDIATKTKLKISESPAIVTVVTAQDIEEMGARNLSDVINTLPGMYFSLPGSGILGAMWADYVRGIYSNQTLHPMIVLMINGTQINDAAQDSWCALNSYGTVFLDFIERIEIIRGPGSVTYGGSAIAGVINIVTKKGSKNEAEAAFGTDGLKKGFLKFSKNIGESRINVLAGLGDSFLSNSEAASSATGSLVKSEKKYLYNFASRNYLLDLSLKGFDWQNMVLWGRMNTPFTQLFMVSADELRARIEHTTILSSLSRSVSLDDARLNSKISYRKMVYSFPFGPVTPPNIPLPLWPDGITGNAEFATDAFAARVEYLYNGLSNQDILAGYESLYEYMDDARLSSNQLNPNSFFSVVYLKGKQRNVNSFYAQDTFYTENRKLSLNLGLRYDLYSDFINGRALSPRVAVVYKVMENYVLKAIYGTAFRPPSFSETNVTPDLPGIKNDPAIRPETIKTFELALDCALLERANLRLNYYNNTVNDLIASVTSDDPAKTWNTNVANQKSWGIESEAKYLLDSRSYLFANASYLGESKDADTGIAAAFVPEWLLNTGVKYAFTDKLSAMVKGFYRSQLKQGPGDTRGDIDPFWLFATSVNYNIQSHNVYLSVYNLMDQAWFDPSISSNNLIEPIQGYGRRFDVGYRYYF